MRTLVCALLVILGGAGCHHSRDEVFSRDLSMAAGDATLARYRLASAEIRNLSTALDAYRSEIGSYPSPTGPQTSFKGLALLVNELADFAPAALPVEDPWGNAYKYWSDGTVFFIVSLSENGDNGTDYVVVGWRSATEVADMLCDGESDRAFDDDLVWTKGRFCRWPPLLPADSR
jgi:hypothetical protein